MMRLNFKANGFHFEVEDDGELVHFTVEDEYSGQEMGFSMRDTDLRILREEIGKILASRAYREVKNDDHS